MKYQSYTFNFRPVARNSASYNIVFTRKISTDEVLEYRGRSNVDRNQTTLGSTLFALIQEILTHQQVVKLTIKF